MTRSYEKVDPIAPPISSHAERQYLHTTEAGAKVPLLQALITASIMGVVVWIFAGVIFYALDAWKWGLGAFAVTLAGTWLITIRQWFSLARVETALGWDINGDGEIGEPRVVRIQLQRVEENGHLNVSKSFDLPISEDELVSLARGLVTGIPFSEREWTGAGKLLSSTRFRELRSEMIKRGLLQLVNDKDFRQGYEPTAEGWAVIRDYADMPE